MRRPKFIQEMREINTSPIMWNWEEENILQHQIKDLSSLILSTIHTIELIIMSRKITKEQ